MRRSRLSSRGGRTFETKRDLAIARLSEAILRGECKPGERLLQNEIAKRFGLSATPIREALTQLQAQGILVHEAHRGSRVAEISLSDLEELYAVRGVLEGYAVQLAVPNLTLRELDRLERVQARMEDGLKRQDYGSVRDADTEFHMILYGAAKNTRLVNVIRQLWGGFPRYLMWLIPGRAEKSAAGHRSVLALLRRRDPEGTAKQLRRNLESGLADLSQYLRSDKAPPFFRRKLDKKSPRVA